jgi:signal transduction histidine kinase
MKFAPARSGLRIGLVAGMAVILVVLGLLQYRWSGQVSEAYRERMQVSLETSAAEFRQEFQRELMRICLAFRLGSPAPSKADWKRYAQLYADWARTSLHNHLVAAVFVWDAAPGHSRLMAADAARIRLSPVEWPREFTESRKFFEARLRQLWGVPNVDVRFFAWSLDERVPALFHPLLLPPDRDTQSSRYPKLVGYLVVELNMAYIKGTLLPQLAKRCFGGPQGFIYRVQVTAGPDSSDILYRSEPPSSAANFYPPDTEINLFGPLPHGALRVALEEDLPAADQTTETAGKTGPLRARPLILPVTERGLWRLSVKYRNGSLDDAVARLRRRSLTAGFGVLALLAISMAMLIVSAQRAHRLARLQVEFTAGVSHELRTPLAVICSAAENLADGVVSAGPQIKEYGELIRREGRRLRSMVDEILLFASVQSQKAVYNLCPVDVREVIDTVLAGASSRLREGGITVEKSIDPALPLAMADKTALGRCLDNLVDNALKYGGNSRWLGVRASSESNGRVEEIQITVEDRGLGIPEPELDYIFEPFYRGSGATALQIHGTGLGLSLAKDMIEAMGGRITVVSAPGEGSAFTIHLRNADRPHEQADTSG